MQFVVLARTQDLGQVDDLPVGIRNFQADHRFAGNHIDHPHRFDAQTTGDVLVQRTDLAALDPRRGFDLETGDDRAGEDPDHLGFDAEITQLEFDLAREDFQRFR